MIVNLVVLLACQLSGEVAARGLGLPVPGPVIGMALLFAALVLRPKLAERIAPTTSGLLAHLSLLFVPAGVGVVGHLDTLGRDGVALIAALLLSTVAAILAGVWVFLAVARLTGASE
ncbi:CidA/LrgA family protein [Limimaricola hongkongensis]|uniref:LrgA protein n=1 Tax=Limimaricola hongkongensis DSM 17492 TaxID=1122180 RepID=A0A017HFT6_9RHOB|nr:CidA/LrgA family protein [Limimaricola hongkongensis]EYD73372.1 LrgA protein [Limimaricola hongkongensis DSM 17492]